MKTYHAKTNKGVALVIVLAMVMLMSALLVAFMRGVTTERTATKVATSGFEARQAAETAVNLVISQIREATGERTGFSWASQPGLIRVFDNENANDTDQDFVYKLYSSDKMKEGMGTYHAKFEDGVAFEETGLSSSEISSGKSLAIDSTKFDGVNINEPVMTVPNGLVTGAVEPRYPIVDPRAGRLMNGDKSIKPGMGLVKGFHVAEMTHPVSDSSGGNPKRDIKGKPIYDVPMRVKWLYQLRDGSLVAKVAATGKIPGANKNNPPVARVAFWTDDESAKINVNTATEPTYWDTPMASTEQEAGRINSSGVVQISSTSTSNPSLNLAAAQPAKSEYQRFPGHPATVSLSPVLRELFADMTDAQYKEAIYRMAPRVFGGKGSSVGGTLNSWVLYFHPVTGTSTGDDDPRLIDRDRLFQSVDDYWFRPDRSPLTSKGWYPVFNDVNGNNIEDTVSLDLANEHLDVSTFERLRFFLTASSRASDLNFAGAPKIPAWPIFDQTYGTDQRGNPISVPNNQNKRSHYDDLIAFCSTIAQKGYFFARARSWDSRYDYETAGRNPGDNAPTSRNKALFRYLQKLADTKFPGVGRSFTEKYPGNESNQILIQIMDYIRSTNIVDTNRRDAVRPPPNNPYPLAFTPGYDTFNADAASKFSGSVRPFYGSGQVTPLIRVDGNSVQKGFGRFPIVSEVGLCFFRDGVETATTVPIRCVLLVEMFTPSPGYTALSETFAYTVQEEPGTPFTISAASPTGGTEPRPMNLASGPSANIVEVDAWRGPHGRFFMPTRGFANQFLYDSAGVAGAASTRTPKALAKGFANQNYPFFSSLIQVPKANGFQFSAGKLRFKFYNTDLSNPSRRPNWNINGQPFHEIVVDFNTPGQMVPVPAVSGADSLSGVVTTLLNGADTMPNAWNAFTIRSVEVGGTTRGDIRLVGMRHIADAGMYEKSRNYTNQSQAHAHNFRDGWGQKYNGASEGALTPQRNNRPTKIVDIHSSVVGAMLGGAGSDIGDFDRGMSKHTDGPFINKPDEGNVRFNTTDDLAGGGALPYYRGGNGYDEVGSNFFSPNRIMSSPVMFGSLPTGRPWETLLFCPPISVQHRGIQTIPDHYLLDWFTMPVVEPFAISEPLSTMGRINLNTRIAPFGYVKDTKNNRKFIERSTGLHGVLDGLYQLTIPNDAPEAGHSERPLTGAAASQTFRRKIHRNATIEKVVEPYLDARHYFRFPSQICELDLLLDSADPNDPSSMRSAAPTGGGEFDSPAKRSAFWNNNNLTGDNARERPYSHIYPRLTTKSNVYTVHVWAQSLSKAPSTNDDDWETFDETRDRVTGEYRASTTIERFLDPNDPALINDRYDAAAATGPIKSLDPYYRFRIVNHKRFIAE